MAHAMSETDLDEAAAEGDAGRIQEPPIAASEGDRGFGADVDDWPPTEITSVSDPVTIDDSGQSTRPAHRRTFRERRRRRTPREPWGPRQWIEACSTLLVVAGCVAFTFGQLHPAQIFSDAVPTGGDMGAHVWAPAYLRDHLLPRGQFSGWSMDWYDGLPVYRYYMLPPALLIVALDVVLSYGMAFKIVAVLGVLTLPVCAWAFGRLARFPFPVPALFAVAATIFLFDETFTILGGNIASTMAGEFSFSIALSLSLLALGVFARGMRTGEHRALAAALIALAALCHGIVVFFVAIGVVLLFLVWADRHRLVYFLTCGVTAFALAAFWLVPFVLTAKYMTDMKYEGAPTPGGQWNSYWRMFFPHLTTVDILWTGAALIGFAAAVVRRHRPGAFLGIYALVLTAMIFLAKQGIPGFGLLWNVRLLPFLYLLRYFLAMLGMIEVVWFVLRVARNERIAREAIVAYPAAPAIALPYGTRPREAARRRLYASVGGLAIIGSVSVGWLAWHLGHFPFEREVYRDGRYQFVWPGDGGVLSTSSKNNGFVDSWALWNFAGYVGRPYYGEYRALMETMGSIGADPDHGCGRALWEHNTGDYGTTMALMLLPFWTDSCIGSSEGLFFEASATTPYHFLAAAALSDKASNPVRGLSYTNANAALGVRYLQDLGIRYYMAYTPGAVTRAAAQPDLIEIAVSGPWHIYEVAGSDVVQPLTTQPVVVEARRGDQRERWLEVGASWYQHPELWSAVPAANGPPSWQRVDVATDNPQPHPNVDLVKPSETIAPVEVPAAKVSSVVIGDESVSFDVDTVGVPVVVKVSYYPNWVASGAEGPYRIAPNFMVVVPTADHVTLRYETSGLEYGSDALSLFGILGLALLWWRGVVAYPDDEGDDDGSAASEPDPFGFDDVVRRSDAETALVRGASPPGDLRPLAPAEPGEPDADRFGQHVGDPAPWSAPSPAMIVDTEWLDLPLAADPTAGSPPPGATGPDDRPGEPTSGETQP